MSKITSANSSIALTLAAACWGLGGVMTKSVLTSVPPLTLLVAQLAVSVAFLWAVTMAHKTYLPAPKEILRLGFTGLLNPGLAYTLSLIGLTFTTASMSALLWAAEPILILGLAWGILHERLAPGLIGFAAAAVFGVALVAGLSPNAGGGSSVFGNLLILAGVGCCAYYTVITRRLAAEADPLMVIAVQQTFALGWALAIWPVELWQGGWGEAVTLGAGAWAWVVASGLTYYALAFWFYIAGLKRIPASTAGQFLNLIPVFGVGAAMLFLGERLSAMQWLGAALILAGVAGIVRMQPRGATATT